MTPTPSRFYAADRCCQDAVSPRDNAGAFACAKSMFDLPDNGFVELSAPMLTAFGDARPALSVAVGYVGELGAEGQMCGVAAAGVVAAVQHHGAGFADRGLAFGQIYAVVQAVGQPVCAPSTPLETNSTVSVGFDIPPEGPAIVWPFDLDEGPELGGSAEGVGHERIITTNITKHKGG